MKYILNYYCQSCIIFASFLYTGAGENKSTNFVDTEVDYSIYNNENNSYAKVMDTRKVLGILVFMGYVLRNVIYIHIFIHKPGVLLSDSSSFLLCPIV